MIVVLNIVDGLGKMRIELVIVWGLVCGGGGFL